MAKTKSAKGIDKISSDGSSKSKGISEGVEEEEPEEGLSFQFLKINNLMMESYPVEVVITILHKGKIIETSKPILIKHSGSHNIETTLEYKVKSIKEIDEGSFVTTPFLVTLNLISNEAMITNSLYKKYNKILDEGTIDLEEEKSIAFDPQLILGEEALDVLPILRGQLCHFEVMLLRANALDTESEETQISSMIELSVLVQPLGNSFCITSQNINNIVTFTIHGINNADLPHFSKNCYCVAGIPFLLELPDVIRKQLISEDSLKGEEEEESFYLEPESYQKPLIFEPGRLEQDIEDLGYKKWSTCTLFSGFPASTKERLSEDMEFIKNSKGIDRDNLFTNIDLSNMVQWNMMRREILDEKLQDIMLKMIIKYKIWPVEIAVGRTPFAPVQMALDSEGGSVMYSKTKSPPEKGRKMSKKQNKKDDAKEIKLNTPAQANVKLFIAFLKIGQILYPGITSVTATGKLYPYNGDFAKYAWGLEEPIMKKWIPDKVSTSDKKQIIDASSSSRPTKKKSELLLRKKEDSKRFKKPDCLKSKKGEPIYIIANISLEKPFYEKRQLKVIEESIQELLPKNKEKFEDSDTGFLKTAKINFKNSIKNLSTIIAKEYIDFKKLNLSKEEAIYYEERDFLTHLVRSGADQLIKETLMIPVSRYVIEVIKQPENSKNSAENIQGYLTHIYAKLIEEMHLIISASDLLRNTKEGSLSPNLPHDQLLFMAAEEDAEFHDKKCHYFMLERLVKSFDNPSFWIDCAIPLIHDKQYHYATQFIRKALSLDPKNKEGLLIFGALMTFCNKMDFAQIIFEGLTTIYPEFTEGWVTLYAFYCLLGKTEFANLTMVTAIKSERYKVNSNEEYISRFPILSWCCKYKYLEGDVLLKTIIYLLSLNLCSFVKACLGKMLSMTGKSKAFYYYLAASNFQSGCYKKSLITLKKMELNDCNDSTIWSLKGHNYYCMKKNDLAKKAYKIAIETVVDKSNITMHLVYLRMAEYLTEDREYSAALNLFKLAISNFPTARAWYGAGVCSFFLSMYDDAELALTESNLLDPCNPLSWAFLALINAKKMDSDNFQQCTEEALKRGLRSRRLLQELWQLWIELNID